MSQDMTICGLEIKRGTKLRTMLPVPDTMTKIPLTVINGVEEGPTLLITAGIHGGEYPGIAAAIELGRDIEPEHVRGCLIILHPVNIQGFWARREFIVPEDGKNLNRVFPGTPWAPWRTRPPTSSAATCSPLRTTMWICTAAISTKACIPMCIIRASPRRKWRKPPSV